MKPFIIVATSGTENYSDYKKWKPLEARKVLISTKKELTLEKMCLLNPKFIFFPHWSYIIPKEIHEQFECIVFHMTDLPFGRGGSPLQNLIRLGIKKTKITAFRAIHELDAGPIYMKRELSIKEGTAQEIYERASKIVFEMIREIERCKPMPIPQHGQVTLFTRRRADESEIPQRISIPETYDFIRMLDADGYPKAFIVSGRRFEFSNAALANGKLTAKVEIS